MLVTNFNELADENARVKTAFYRVTPRLDRRITEYRVIILKFCKFILNYWVYARMKHHSSL